MSVSQDARNVVLHPIALQFTETVQSIDDLPFSVLMLPFHALNRY